MTGITAYSDVQIDDGVELIASLESLYEQFKDYSQLRVSDVATIERIAPGVITDNFNGMQYLSVDAAMESLNGYKSGIIVATIAAIVAAIVYAIRKFFKLPNIINIKKRITDALRLNKEVAQATKSKEKDKFISTNVVASTTKSLDALLPEYAKLKDQYIRLTWNTAVADYTIPEFVSHYASHTSIYEHVSDRCIASILPGFVLTDNYLADIKRISTLTALIPASLGLKLNTVSKWMTQLKDTSADQSNIVDTFYVPDTALNDSLKQFYGTYKDGSDSSDVTLAIKVGTEISDLLSYDKELPEGNLIEYLKRLHLPSMQSAIIDVQQHCLDASKVMERHMSIVQTDLPFYINAMKCNAEAAGRLNNNDARKAYVRIQNQLQEQLYAINKTVTIIALVTEGFDRLSDQLSKMDREILSFVNNYSSFTTSLVNLRG